MHATASQAAITRHYAYLGLTFAFVLLATWCVRRPACTGLHRVPNKTTSGSLKIHN